ncbi:MAG: FAD-dependent oxidoreductase [Anaerolineae bacterium]|nr:FAD-dependent oxidoreductase [Anaerolineae bacterium]
MMITDKKHIVVLGGGYGGMMAALRLAGKSKRLTTTVTLVNALDYFVERPRLHEQATGVQLKNRSMAYMLRGTKVDFVQGWVTAIDPGQQVVRVRTAQDDKPLRYDYLVNALGSHVDRETVPGVADYAFTLDPYGERTTTPLQQKLTAFGQRSFQVVVVGGGATGIETATQIKGVYPHSTVTLVTQGQAGAFKGPQIQQHMIQALREQSIHVCEYQSVTRVNSDSVVLASGWLPADVVVWAGGFMASPLAKEAGLQVNRRHQILVDPYLRSLSHPNIYAVGDAAWPVEEPGAPMRMSLFTALVSGAQAADNIMAEIKDQSPRPLSFAYYGQGIALGPQDAVGFATYPADAAWKLIFRRKSAVAIRNFFIWLLGGVLEMERRFPGFFFWNGRERYNKQRRRGAIAKSRATN